MMESVKRAVIRWRQRRERKRRAPGYVGTGCVYGSWAPGFYPPAMPRGNGGAHVPGVVKDKE